MCILRLAGALDHDLGLGEVELRLSSWNLEWSYHFPVMTLYTLLKHTVFSLMMMILAS